MHANIQQALAYFGIAILVSHMYKHAHTDPSPTSQNRVGDGLTLKDIVPLIVITIARFSSSAITQKGALNNWRRDGIVYGMNHHA